MFFRKKKSGDRTYFRIVENRWEEGLSKQRVICTLGRLDELKASGQLDRLISSGAKFSESMMVIEAHDRGGAPVIGVRRIGPGMIFERLWKETGPKEVMVDDRRYAVCVNEDQAKEDALDRAAIIATLQKKLKQGDVTLPTLGE